MSVGRRINHDIKRQEDGMVENDTDPDPSPDPDRTNYLRDEYWHAVVEVTQLPFQDEKRLHFKDYQTWLLDSMFDYFGLRLTCNRGMRFEFYWDAKDEPDG